MFLWFMLRQTKRTHKSWMHLYAVVVSQLISQSFFNGTYYVNIYFCCGIKWMFALVILCMTGTCNCLVRGTVSLVTSHPDIWPWHLTLTSDPAPLSEPLHAKPTWRLSRLHTSCHYMFWARIFKNSQEFHLSQRSHLNTTLANIANYM